MSQAVNQVRRLLLLSLHRHHPSRNLSQNGMARVVVIQHHRAGGGAQLGQPLSFRVANASFIPVRFFIIYCVANAFPVVSPRYLDTLLLYIFPSPLLLVMRTHKCIPLQICASAASRDRYPTHLPTSTLPHSPQTLCSFLFTCDHLMRTITHSDVIRQRLHPDLCLGLHLHLRSLSGPRSCQLPRC